MRSLDRHALFLLALAPVFASAPAAAQAAASAPVAFYIAKSQNRNQVEYAIRLDAACRPVGDAPVFAFWRMRERGGAVEPLLSREQPAYGIAEQRVEDGAVTVRLRAIPDRPIRFEPASGPSGCTVTARTTIAGRRARLAWVFVQLSWAFGVDHLRLAGTRDDGGAPVEERLEP